MPAKFFHQCKQCKKGFFDYHEDEPAFCSQHCYERHGQRRYQDRPKLIDDMSLRRNSASPLSRPTNEE